MASGITALTLPVSGQSRTAIVHVPTGINAEHAVPVVLDLHGSGSTPAQQEGFTDMDATADADGFIVAYPQAAITSGSGFDWNVPGEPLIGGARVPAHAANDVRFLTQLVSELESRYCVDAARVYATGFSGGARMVSQLACDAAGTFAAVAPVSGLRLPTSCRASRAVPIIAFHGTADPVDPYDGHGQKYWTYSVPIAARRWATRDTCTTPAATSQPAAGVTLTAYSGCRDGATVELFTVTGEGHEWPGGPHLTRAITSVLGPQSGAISANALMWGLFSSVPPHP